MSFPVRSKLGIENVLIVRGWDVVQPRTPEDAKRIVDLAEEQQGSDYVVGLIGHADATSQGEVHARERLVEQLLNGEKHLVRVEARPRLLDAPKVQRLADLSDDASVQEKARDFIALRLLDADEQPVADEPYVVVLADGTEIEGRTDADGFARHDGVISGTCRISFPRAGGAVFDDLEAARRSVPEATSHEPVAEQAEADRTASTESPLVSPPEQASAPNLTWITIEVEDADGLPVRHERYELVLPTGKAVSGALDECGRLEVTDIERDGQCELRLISRSISSAPTKLATGAAHRVGLPAS